MDLAIKKAKEHGIGWVVCKGQLKAEILQFTRIVGRYKKTKQNKWTTSWLNHRLDDHGYYNLSMNAFEFMEIGSVFVE